MYDRNPQEIDFGLSYREVRVSEGLSYWESTVSMKLTINLANILDRNYPLRTLEMAQFQNIKIQNFLGEHAPQHPCSLGLETTGEIHQ